jgi:hypothetical protein
VRHLYNYGIVGNGLRYILIHCFDAGAVEKVQGENAEFECTEQREGKKLFKMLDSMASPQGPKVCNGVRKRGGAWSRHSFGREMPSPGVTPTCGRYRLEI